MTSQLNWQKIRTELNRLTDVEKLKSEVQRIGAEIAKFDFHSVLSPAAQDKVQEKMKKFEQRYTDLMRTINQAQVQMDREVNRIVRQIKVHRADMDKVVSEQKSKLEKASEVLRARFTKKSAGVATPGATRKRAKPAAAKVDAVHPVTPKAAAAKTTSAKATARKRSTTKKV